MSVAQRFPLRAAFAVLLVPLGLAGCAMDDEASVRAELSRWASLGDAVFFESKMDCTAAIFASKTSTPKAIRIATHLDEAIRLIDADQPVAFAIDGASPNTVSEQLMSANLPGGLGLISSGISGKNCMGNDQQAAYFETLQDPGAFLIYAPATNGLAVLDPTRKRVIFARGNV